MAKKDLSIVSRILSDIPAPALKEPKSEEATKNRKLKGFYLTVEKSFTLPKKMV